MPRLLPILLVALTSCGPPPAPERPRRPDPTIRTLDRLLVRERTSRADPDGGEELQRCLARAEQEHACSLPDARRTLALRIALDARYPARWPGWESRLSRTLACVNTIYGATGLQFEAADIVEWSPTDRERNDLYALLDRVQRELPDDRKSLVVGITVWDDRRVYSGSGGEIGLSQRASCVVPSWPRVENDCIILAHELGHLVGARHVPGKQWLMGWAARPFHLPAADPIARVIALYRFHPRNRAAVAMHRRARFGPHGLRLTRSCRDRLRAIDRCWRL